MTLEGVLIVLGILFILEAVVGLLYTKNVVSWTIKLMKDPKRLRKWIIGELVLGIVLLIISTLL